MVLATANADGSNVQQPIRADSAHLNLRSPAWSPDRNEIAFVRGRGGVTGELWALAAGGGHATATDTNYAIAISPAGTLMATSNSNHISDEIWLLRPGPD
jgi:WD40 repeat protein